MPTISAKVNKRELDAIQEYANACGETISNLIRKIVLREVTLMNCYPDSQEYDTEISIPENVSAEEEDQIVQNTHNKIRRILSHKEISKW